MIEPPLCKILSYVHNIMVDNDPDTAECKIWYNDVLITNPGLHKLHEDNEQDLRMNTENSFNNATIYQIELEKWKKNTMPAPKTSSMKYWI